MAQHAYIGCRTTKERGARGKGISIYSIDEKGSWKLEDIVEGLVNPSYLCLDRTGNFLYSIHGDMSEISAFSVDSKGGLRHINTVSTEGINPVHLTVDKNNRWIYVANLQTGTVAVIGRAEDGSLSGVKNLYTIPGIADGDISHPHQVALDRSEDHLIVSCQGRKAGYGQVDVFRIDHMGGLQKTCEVRSRIIAEPRHLVFHPNNKWAYGVNEKDYTATFYRFDEEKGRLEPVQIIPTLPDSCTEDGWASGIIISEDGRYIVISDRKYDCITSFSIDHENGRLSYCDFIKTDGRQPRFITFDGEGHNIWAANELTDTMTEFELDRENGKLSATGRSIQTESPVCCIFS